LKINLLINHKEDLIKKYITEKILRYQKY